jgi:hypothetical protein
MASEGGSLAGVGEATAIAKAGLEIAQLLKKHGIFGRVATFFKKKQHVLVLGSTGTGKTNFLDSLGQLTMPEPIDHLARTGVALPVKLVVGGKPFAFVDTPGQFERRRNEAIRDALRHERLGIINVVSYGYHEYATGSKEPTSPKAAVREDFLRRHREIEIQHLSQWIDLVGDAGATRWLTTVVTKADLWWERRDEVLDFYRTGPYFEALSDFRSAGSHVAHYCSVFHKFFSQGAMAGTFDEVDRVKAKANFLRLLIEVAGS